VSDLPTIKRASALGVLVGSAGLVGLKGTSPADEDARGRETTTPS
jgi:hypothetical protein